VIDQHAAWKLEEQTLRQAIDKAQRLTREWLEAHPPGGN
ncbi:uncharacterized protein METZ01_LOCUS102434, partial [marine metagenome]